MIRFLLFQLIFIPAIFKSSLSAVLLDKESEVYVQNIISEFEADQRNGRFDHIIEPPLRHAESNLAKRMFFLPRLFLWCPMTHHEVEIKCPIHHCTLELGHWSDILTRRSPRNPRLVFDTGENILLVQRFYQCRHNHRYLSTHEDIMYCLPKTRRCLMPVRIFYRSACTLRLIDFIFEWVGHGVNFLQIVDSIANLNYRTYLRRLSHFLVTLSECNQSVAQHNDFERSELFGFPSKDKIIQIFLDDFHKKRPFYDDAMHRLVARNHISTDHTFKVSKSVGTYRQDDNKFIKQFENLFIVLNENNEVIGFRLTRSTSHSEVKDLLEDIKSRLSMNEIQLEYAVVDKCCGPGGEANFYKSIFGSEMPVKLDLFHAVQRVLKHIKGKGNKESQSFCKEFGLVFRANEDFDHQRKMSTPEPAVIKRNLDDFIARWKVVFQSNVDTWQVVLGEIDKLKIHIDNGCLSNIRPASGTAGNERLHRLLNHSLLSGVANIGPELIIAVLTVIFYSYNLKIKGSKHDCSVRVTPCLPIEASLIDFLLANRSMPDNNKQKKTPTLARPRCDLNEQDDVSHGEDRSELLDQSDLLHVTSVNDLLHPSVISSLIHQIFTVSKLLAGVQQKCSRRDYSVFEAPIICIGNINLLHAMNMKSSTTDNSMQRLENNLASFNLQREEIAPDGDCAFRAIVRQLHKFSSEISDEEQLQAFQKSLAEVGITTDNEDADIYHLRQAFVNRLENDPTYHHFLLSAELSDDQISAFRQPGVWQSNIGDFVVRVCSDVLRISIFVISSSLEMPVVPYIPVDLQIDSPLYVAYSPGHYSATNVRQPSSCRGRLDSVIFTIFLTFQILAI